MGNRPCPKQLQPIYKWLKWQWQRLFFLQRKDIYQSIGIQMNMFWPVRPKSKHETSENMLSSPSNKTLTVHITPSYIHLGPSFVLSQWYWDNGQKGEGQTMVWQGSNSWPCSRQSHQTVIYSWSCALMHDHFLLISEFCDTKGINTPWIKWSKWASVTTIHPHVNTKKMDDHF